MKSQDTQTISSDLIRLSKNISCNFIDSITSTKTNVKITSDLFTNRPRIERKSQFLLSTCLRYEVYNCDGDSTNIDPLYYVKSYSCLRRLLSLMVGLQSEIVGEREILTQITQSVNKYYSEGYLDKSDYSALVELVSIAEKIRKDSEVNCLENYSTIGANFFIDRFSNRSNLIFVIVGGGYMAERFFRALLSENSIDIRKIFWINRSVTRIENNIKGLIDLLDFDIEVHDLTSGASILKEADGIFCALANSEYYYKEANYSEDTLVVDVSYPQVFLRNEDSNLVTVSNTDFSNYVRNPVPKTNIISANKEIDEVITLLMSHV